MAKAISNINIIKFGLWVILAASAVLEMILFTSIENLVGCAVTFVSTWLFFTFVFKIDTVRRRPIAFIAFLQLFLFMYLPLPATLLDGNGMSHDLFTPIKTYLLQLVYYCVGLLAFCVSGRWYAGNKVYNIMQRWGYYKTPSRWQLWLLGFIGLFFRLILMSRSGEGGVAGGGSLNMFSVLIYCPILILFGQYLGWKPCGRPTKFLIWGYVSFLVVLFVATNSRSQMLSPLVVMAFCYLIGQIYVKHKRLWLTPKKFILIFVLALVIMGPASDMATAMVVVRHERTEVSVRELIGLTFDAYKDKARLNAYRQLAQDIADEQVGGEWVENYVSSPFLERLCNYRVVDLTIYHAEKIGLANEKMLNFFVDCICTMFPGPISNFLFPEIDKSELSFSPMDYLYHLSTRSGTRSYRVGGDVGLGLATFGYAYFILCFLIYTLVFYIIDGVAHIDKGKLKISIFTLISIYFTYFLMFQVGTGLSAQTQFVLWGFWWSTLWYCIIYKIIRTIAR